jgi:hypothetical protein
MKFRRGQSVDKAISIDTASCFRVTASYIVICIKQVCGRKKSKLLTFSEGNVGCF